MIVLVWNLRRATHKRENVWNYFQEIDPDIALLQEVGSLPSSILDNYSKVQRHAYAGNGKQQIFSTVVLSKGSLNKHVTFSTPWDWVNEELQNFAGNIVAAEITLDSGNTYTVVSVYCPAWPIFNRNRLTDIDVTDIKLKNSPDVWLTEILWAALSQKNLPEHPWIIAGDFNSSVTFDTMWKGGPHGNQEMLDRMSALGLTECLLHHQGRLTPTFRNPSNKQVIHQIDHLFVPDKLTDQLLSCETGNANQVFEKSLSDHLPIIAYFK